MLHHKKTWNIRIYFIIYQCDWILQLNSAFHIEGLEEMHVWRPDCSTVVTIWQNMHGVRKQLVLYICLANASIRRKLQKLKTGESLVAILDKNEWDIAISSFVCTFSVIVKNSYISKFLDFYFVHYLVGDTIEINMSQPQCRKSTCNKTALQYGFQPWTARQHSNISNLEYVDQSLVYSRNFSWST